jgi:integrase/recombinase XerD
VSSDPLPAQAEDFLLWLSVERGRSTATLAAYRRDLRSFVDWLGEDGADLDGVGEEVIIDYLRHRQGLGLAPATVARSMVSVRSLFRFMVAEELRADDPTVNVEMPRVPRGLPKALGERQVADLLAAVTGTDGIARRDRAILEVLYGTGVRISELVGMSVGDVDMSAALVRVLGKGSKERVIPLGRYALDALASYLDVEGRGALEPERWGDRSDATAVFLNVRGGRLSRQGGWGVLKKCGARVGLGSELSPHTLRHCCATHMLEHGADIRTVQELLGHASITTTQVYTRVSRSQLVAAYRAAHPRARL